MSSNPLYVLGYVVKKPEVRRWLRRILACVSPPWKGCTDWAPGGKEGLFLIIGFEVRGLRRAFLIASKEVGMVKGVCCGGRTLSGGKGGSQFGSGVGRTARGLSHSGSSNLR